MRLTADLINSSLSYLNPLKERELDLRGHKIPTLENLGVAGPHDALDLTDNDITSLSNIPLSPRLSTILLARNRITHIAPNLAGSVPNLSTLVLTANNVAELADLDPLRKCVRLTHLAVLENPVSRKDNYRYFLIWRHPTLRFLDYAKVTSAEREHAASLFGTDTAPSELASKILGTKSRTFDVGGVAANGGGGGRGAAPEKAMRVKLTATERARVEKMIREAKSLQEISRLEKELNEGRVPAGAADGEGMDM